MAIILTILSILLSTVLFVYFFYRRKFSYWKDIGIAGPPPSFPFGNTVEYGTKGHFRCQLEWSQKYGRLFGWYSRTNPVLAIIDPVLIKQVMVKDFACFVNRMKRQFDHEIMNLNLTDSEGEQWRRIRVITTPTFTAAKLRGMHTLMDRAVDKLTNYFDKVIATTDGQVNIKQVMIGFSVDVFANVAFATETDANGDRDKPNAFLYNCMNLDRLTVWKWFCRGTMPIAFNKLIQNNSGRNNTEGVNFLINFAREIINQRKLEMKIMMKNKENKRHDLVQLLIDSLVSVDKLNEADYDKLTADADHNSNVSGESNSNDRNSERMQGLTEDEIIAQCIVFFIGGFAPISSTISHCLYNLATNPEIQNQLRDQLSLALNGLESTSDQYYETVMTKVPLLEAVIKETLRLTPTSTETVRQLNAREYTIGGVNLYEGQHVHIPIYAIHHNPEYYPEPDQFKPSRFMPENKHLLVPYTYLPFGAGPRNCIAMRFAHQEMKLCLAKIVRLYRFSPTKDTPIPLKYTKVGFLSCANIPMKISKI